MSTINNDDLTTSILEDDTTVTDSMLHNGKRNRSTGSDDSYGKKKTKKKSTNDTTSASSSDSISSLEIQRNDPRNSINGGGSNKNTNNDNKMETEDGSAKTQFTQQIENTSNASNITPVFQDTSNALTTAPAGALGGISDSNTTTGITAKPNNENTIADPNSNKRGWEHKIPTQNAKAQEVKQTEYTKLTVILKNEVDNDNHCAIGLKSEIDFKLKLKDVKYTAVFLDKRTISLWLPIDHEDGKQLLDVKNWPINFYGGVQEIGITVKKKPYAVLKHNKLPTIKEKEYLKDTYGIIDCKQLGNSNKFRIEFTNEERRNACLQQNALMMGATRVALETYNDNNIVQCYRCQSLGHITKNCNATKLSCKYCTQEHISSKCPSKTKGDEHKCSNCKENNNHRSDDRKNCPLYKKHYESTMQKLAEKSSLQKNLNSHIDQLHNKIRRTNAQVLFIAKKAIDTGKHNITELCDEILDNGDKESIMALYNDIKETHKL